MWHRDDQMLHRNLLLSIDALRDAERAVNRGLLVARSTMQLRNLIVHRS